MFIILVYINWLLVLKEEEINKHYYSCSLSWLLLLLLGFTIIGLYNKILFCNHNFQSDLTIMLYFKVMNAHSHFVYFIFSVLNCLLWCKSFDWNETNSRDFLCVCFVFWGGDRFSRALWCLFLEFLHAWESVLCVYTRIKPWIDIKFLVVKSALHIRSFHICRPTRGSKIFKITTIQQ